MMLLLLLLLLSIDLGLLLLLQQIHGRSNIRVSLIRPELCGIHLAVAVTQRHTSSLCHLLLLGMLHSHLQLSLDLILVLMCKCRVVRY